MKLSKTQLEVLDVLRLKKELVVNFEQVIYDYWDKYDELHKNSCIKISTRIYNYYLFQGHTWSRDLTDMVTIMRTVAELPVTALDIRFAEGKLFDNLGAKLYEKDSNWVYTKVDEIEAEVMVEIRFNKQTVTKEQLQNIIEQLLEIRDGE